MKHAKGRLLLDPELPWGQRHPYAHLARRLGGGTESSDLAHMTHRQVCDLFFDLSEAARPTPEDRSAWDALRSLTSRILIDFFLYEVQDEAVESSSAPEEGPQLAREAAEIRIRFDRCEQPPVPSAHPMPPETTSAALGLLGSGIELARYVEYTDDRR